MGKLTLPRGWTAIIAIAISSVILLVPVLLNGFPFIFPDSGDYLVFTPLIHRSPYYGLLIFFFHMNRWIWAPVFMQAVIVSHLIWLTLKLHGVGRPSSATILVTVILGLFSSLPFFVGFIMADLFTPIMIVAIYIIGFHYSALTPALKVYLVLLACVATAAHVSNLTIAIVLLGVCFVLLSWSGWPWGEVWRRLGILLIPVGLTAAAILLFNIAIFSTLSLTPAGSTFFMANLIEYGPARDYLKEVCPDAGYKMCTIVDQLPKTADQFLSTTGMFDELAGIRASPQEPPKHSSGFLGMRSESKAIVAGTIAKYPGPVANMVMHNFISGLFTHEPAAEFRPEIQTRSMIELLTVKFGRSAASDYLRSAEMRDSIPHGFIRRIDSVAVPVMFLALVTLGLSATLRGARQIAAFAAFILSAILANTLLCTAVSGVHDRYQARVTWLLPMAVFVIGLSLIAGRRSGTASVHRAIA